MTGFSALDGALGGGAAALARQLTEVATSAGNAAKRATGDYINDPSKLDLQIADKAAGRAIAQLEQLLPQVAQEGGEDGARVAATAVTQLKEGRKALRDGVTVEDEILRGGAVVVDRVETGAAGGLFADAAFAVQGLADGFTFSSTSLDDMYRAVTQHLG
jgi:hypothetical protein